MAEDNINNTQVQPVELSRAEERIKQLSDKVELTARERDEKVKLVEQLQSEKKQLEQENSFNSGFADILASYSMAKDHKDEIKEKVLKGYSVEDATFAVLGKAGLLAGGTPVVPQVAGGSATTTVTTDTSTKPVQEMSLTEKRAQLEKDLAWS